MPAFFEVYEDAAGEWRWRLKAGNGEIVAGSEDYATRDKAERAVGDVQAAAVQASGQPIRVKDA